MRYLILFLLSPLGVFSQLDSIPLPPIDSIPPCVITNLQGEISCFPWSPNQGELSVNWEAPPGCQPIGFHRGDDLDNLQFIPYGPWFGNYFYGYAQSTPVSSSEYYFIVESPGGVMDTLVLDNPNCGLGCMDPLASNYNPFAGIESEFEESCLYGNVSECGDTITQNVYVSITGDTFSQWETSWEILTTDSVPVVLASEEEGFYETAGLNVTTEYCIPLGVEFTFNIYDSYGDGLAGSTTGGSADGDVLVYTECGNVIYSILPFEGQNPDFGYEANSVPNLLNPCPPENPPFGCLDPNYLEFNSLAENSDQSQCITPAIPGCINENAFNYDSLANTMDLVPECEYTLMLFDGGGDGWDNSYLGVVQDGEPIGAFTCTDQDAFYNITVSSLTHVEFTFYPVEFGGFFGQGGTVTDISQVGFKLIKPNGDIVFDKGTNPWLDPVEPNKTYTPYLRCGNYCEPYSYGCTDETAQNYNADVNTEDGSCYYQAGCTQAGYLEYYTQGYEADYDNGDCQTLAVFGCMDEQAFNYNPEANVDNEGCIPVVLGCMNPLAFNYNSAANTDDDSCIPFVYGCTDATMFNYDPEANAEDGSCIPYIYGCTDSSAFNYDPTANTDNGSCEEVVVDCMDPAAFNYNPNANEAASNCLYAADCITGPGEPYWLNDMCYAWVIQADPYCCDEGWDNTCQATYDYCSATGIESILAGNDLVVYPNPVGNVLNINQNVDIDVIDSNGRILLSKTNTNAIDASLWPPGMYMVRIVWNGRVVVKRVIK